MPTTNTETLINNGDWLKITHPSVEEGGDGQIVYVRIKSRNVGVSKHSASQAKHSDTIG